MAARWMEGKANNEGHADARGHRHKQPLHQTVWFNSTRTMSTPTDTRFNTADVKARNRLRTHASFLHRTCTSPRL